MCVGGGCGGILVLGSEAKNLFSLYRSLLIGRYYKQKIWFEHGLQIYFTGGGAVVGISSGTVAPEKKNPKPPPPPPIDRPHGVNEL